MHVVTEIFFKMQWMRGKQTLSGFSWNLGSRHLCLRNLFSHSPRADPHANTEEKEATPMEIAAERDNFEVLVVLAGFAEVSADKKLDFLRMILEDKGFEQISTPCEYVEEFKKNLESLSISEVGSKVCRSGFHMYVVQVLEKQLSLTWHLAPDWKMNVNMIQFAAARGRTDLLQLLFDHG